MHGVAVLLMAAAVAHVVARALDLPALPFLLAAGIVLSRVAHLEPGLVEDALVLGVSFLLFLAGLELDPRRIREQTTAAVRVGVVQFVGLASVGLVASAALGFAPIEAVYLGLALSASSTLVCVRMLQRRRRMFEPFGRLVLGVLLLQDLLVLLTIPVLTGLTGGWREAAVGVAGVAALTAFALGVRRWASPWLLRLADEPETLVLAAFALLFACLAFGHGLGLPTVVGAFLAGVALARFPVNKVAWSCLAPVGDFFTAIFFTALGAVLLVPTPNQLLQAGVLALLLLATTVPLVAIVAERSGMSARSSIEAGLLLSQTSEISLVIGLSGMLAGHIEAGVFTVIALVTVVTMLWTPFLGTDRVAWTLVHRHPFRSRAPEGEPPTDHLLLLGAGATGTALLEDLVITGASIVVVDDDPAVIERVEEAGLRGVRGDATDPRVLRRAGASGARAVCSTLRRARDNESALAEAAGRPVLVRVFEEEDVPWVEARGGTPFLYSRATADGLMAWWEERAPA